MTVQDTYTVQRLGAEDGPYTAQELQMQVRSGRLQSNTLVKKADGTGNWFVASEIPGLFSNKEYLTAVLLSLFVGVLGVDRFYLGIPVSGS